MKKLNEYEINLYGKIHNLEELKIDRENIEEELLKRFLEKGENLFKKLNGEYTISIKNLNRGEEIIVRDKIGVMPLYFTIKDNKLYHSNRIDELIKMSKITPVLDKSGIKMLFGIGPAKESGKTLIKDIYEVMPGHYYLFKEGKILTFKYFDFLDKFSLDDKEKSKIKIKNILEDSIKIRSKEECSVMLSGGLDSSLVTTLLNKKNLKSFSVNYENNDKDFKANKYQGTKDSDYIKIMVDKLNLKHTNIVISKDLLVNNLEKALLAREFPGMGDIDSSLLVFLEKIKEKGVNNIFTGECADEIFLGYPWLYKDVNSDLVPFINNINLREKLIKPGLLEENELKNYVEKVYGDIVKDLDITDVFKKYNYLTIKLFMPVLAERIKKLSEYVGINVEIPFADYRIFEYIFNLPFEYKITENYNEKSLLKEIYKDKLPYEIIKRKKSPYPKTYDKEYAKKIEEIVLKIISDNDSRIHEIIDTKYLKEIILNSDKESVDKNFFGQLMTYPQVLAYIIQIEIWLNKYKIKVQL